MKKGLVFFLTLLISWSVYAVGDGIIAAEATHLQTAMQKVEYQLMRLQAVQQIKILYDNYLETKKYYEEIKEKSHHRGGLLGYYSDEFTGRVKSDAMDEWERIQNMKNKSDDTLVKRWVEGGEEAVIKQLDKGADKIINDGETRLASLVDTVNDFNKKGKARDEQLVKLSKEANGDLTDKKLESLQLQAQLLQLEILSSLDKTNRIKLSNEVDSFQLALSQQKTNLAFTNSVQKAFSSQNETKKKEGRITEEQIFNVLKERP